MPREFSRARRVSELMRRELSELIRTGVRDPRVAMATVMAVDVSSDLRNAMVHVAVLGDSAAGERAVEALNGAAGYLRRELAPRLRLRVMPALQFRHDTSVARGVELSALIDRAVAESGSGEHGE